MWLSKCFKIPKLPLRDFILKFIVLVCISYNFSEAQTKIGFKSFSDLNNSGIDIDIFKNKPYVFCVGEAPSDANKTYCINALFDNNFDTVQTITSHLINNVPGNYLRLQPFTNTKNKLFYWGIGSNYGSSSSNSTFIFGNANQTDYTLLNHKAYYSKYYHRPNYTNTFLNDSTFISSHWFKWSHPSSLPYGTSMWWFNKNMDTLQQKVYFEASGNTNLLSTITYPLPNKDILVAGFTDTIDVFSNPYNYDAFLMRLDSAGNVKYARSIGTSGHENMYLTEIGNKYYMMGTTVPSYSNSATSNFYLAEIDIANGNVGKTYKTTHTGTGIVLMNNPSAQNNNIYLPCMLNAAVPGNLKSCYFLIDTTGVISKQYIHSQTSNGYWNSYTMPIVTDSLKNLYGSIMRYNNNTDPKYSVLFKLDSNLVGCYPSDTPFSFTTTIATGALHSLPMSISIARDSVFDVTTPGAIIQGHGFNTMLDECSGYVGIEEHEGELKNSNFKIFPNPSSGIFYYQVMSDELNDATLEVYDLTGKRIISGALSSNNANGYIDLSSVTNGIYFVKIANSQKILFNTKLNVVK